MRHKVEVAIIGAGTGGLSALKEVQRRTKDFVLINHGPYGTTCARTGCMPSKALVQIAHDFHRRYALNAMGIRGAEGLTLDLGAALAYVRSLRDRFVGGVLKRTEGLGERNLTGRAYLLDPHRVQVGDTVIEAKAIVIATGSSPIVPSAWTRWRNRILTTETLFEQSTLGPRVAVIGLGPVGLEVGQALARLGLEVTGFDRGETVGGLTDPTITQTAIQEIGKEFPLHLGVPAELTDGENGVRVVAGDNEVEVDEVVAALGRRPNLDNLGLENLGVDLDEHGLPTFDPTTMQVGELPVFLAGDVNGYRPLLHEGADEGRIAGYNAVRELPVCFERRVALEIVFTEPNIAMVGHHFRELESGHYQMGEASFEGQGRALIANQAAGRLHLYADPEIDGQLLGGELMAPNGEHLAHLLAWLVQQGLTAFEALQLPVYHPVVEEGLRTALREVASRVDLGQERPELAFCDAGAIGSLD